MRYNIINVLKSNNFVNFFTEEDWKGDLEDSFNFESDCQDDHGHGKGGEDVSLLTSSFFLKMLLNFGNSNEDLFQMVTIQWYLIKMAKHPPITQMAYKANKL